MPAPLCPQTYMAALLRANPGAAQALCRQLVSRYLPAPSSPHDSASQPADYGISVPLEQLVQVASTLASHLTATAGSLQTPEEAAGAASPPAKRPKATSNKRGEFASCKRLHCVAQPTSHSLLLVVPYIITISAVTVG